MNLSFVVMKKKLNIPILSFLALLLFQFFVSNSLNAQFFPSNAKQADSLYQVNIKKKRINGVYIPATLEEAFEEIKTLSDPAAITKFKLGEEDEVVRGLHFGLGRWIRINWNLEQGSRLSHYLRMQKIHRSDDMVDAIMRTFHRHLNNKPLDLETLVADYDRKWNDFKKAKYEDGETISETKKDQP